MRLVDHLLEDEQLLDTVYETQGERYPQSRSRGRMQTPAEVVLRLLLLKQFGTGAMKCWSEKYGPIWSTERSLESAMKRYRMPRRWRGWGN